MFPLPLDQGFVRIRNLSKQRLDYRLRTLGFSKAAQQYSPESKQNPATMGMLKTKLLIFAPVESDSGSEFGLKSVKISRRLGTRFVFHFWIVKYQRIIFFFLRDVI